MIYRFEILTEDYSYEGWAHTPEEMSHRFSAEFPGVDHEVFPNRDKHRRSYAPKMLTLSEYRDCLAQGMHELHIAQLDDNLST